jgi:hypothetical protein
MDFKCVLLLGGASAVVSFWVMLLLSNIMI